MKKYLAPIDGTMRVVTKTGRTACEPLPKQGVGRSLAELEAVNGGVAFVEVEEETRVTRNGGGQYRHWVPASHVYEVAGENIR